MDIIYCCPECGREYDSRSTWRHHLNTKHGYDAKSAEDLDFKEISPTLYQCRLCDARVPNATRTSSLLMYHHFTHLPYAAMFLCRYCNNEYTKKVALVDHIKRVHKEMQFNNSKDDQLQLTESASTPFRELLNPIKNDEFYMRFMCPHCNKEFIYQHQWMQHIDTAHTTTSCDLRLRPANNSSDGSVKRYHCQLCYTAVLSNDRTHLQRHRFLHLPFPAFIKCAYCPVRKAHKFEVLQHFSTVHEREFVRAKPYMRVPIEWGESVNEKRQLVMRQLLEQAPPLAPTTRKFPSTTAPSTKDLRNLVENLEDSYTQSKSKRTIQRNVTENNSKETEPEPDLDALCVALLDSLDDQDLQISENSNNQPEKTINTDTTTFSSVQSNNSMQRLAMSFSKQKSEISGRNTDHSEHKRQQRVREEPMCTIVVGLPENNVKSISKAPDCREQLHNLLDNQIIYLCPECGDSFQNHHKWRSHIHGKHDLLSTFRPLLKNVRNPYDEDGRIDYTCQDCKKIIPSATAIDLQRHRFIHTSHQSYLRCRLCKVAFSNRPSIDYHLRTEHADWVATQLQEKVRNGGRTNSELYYMDSGCPDCGKQFMSRFWKEKHRKLCQQRHVVPNTTNRLYNITENTRLLMHLQSVNERLMELQ